jgi:hypothetical protein
MLHLQKSAQDFYRICAHILPWQQIHLKQPFQLARNGVFKQPPDPLPGTQVKLH